MRAGRSVRPCAMASAAPIPCVGTKPSWRAAAASRQPATSTAPRRPMAGWQADHSRNGRRGWQERPARYASSARLSAAASRSACAQLFGLAGAARPERLEEGPVGLLGRVRKAAAEPAEEDRRPAFDERERVAPEPEGEPERRDRRRVRGSAPLSEGAASRAEFRCRSHRARSSSLADFESTPRTRASAWATEGGPAKTASAESSLGRCRKTPRRTAPGQEAEQAAQTGSWRSGRPPRGRGGSRGARRPAQACSG